MRLLVSFAIAFLPLQIISQERISLSLDDAIDLALHKNYDIVKENFNLSSAEYALKEAKGNFLPKVSLNARYNWNIERPVIFFPDADGTGSTATELGSENDYTGSFGLNIPAFSKYNAATKKLAEVTLSYQDEVANGTQQTVVNTVRKAYFNYLIVQEIEHVQQSQLKNSEENLEDIRKRKQQGKLTDFDLTSAKVQVAKAKNSLLEAQSNIIPAANDLILLLGLEINTVLDLTEPIALLESELFFEANVNQVLEQNSTLKQLEFNIDLNEKQIEQIQSAFYPTIDVIGSYNYQTQADDFRFSNYDWVHTSLVGLQMSFSIFNGNVTKNQVQQTKIDKEIAQQTMENTTREFQMQFEELLSQLDFSKQKVFVQKENMELSEEALELSKKRYRFGVGTFLEVNDAELSYTQAQLNWLQAISDYKSAYYDYQLLIGKQ